MRTFVETSLLFFTEKAGERPIPVKCCRIREIKAEEAKDNSLA